MRHFAIVTCGLMALAAPALAQDVDCENAVSQNAMTYCAEQRWMGEDANLNDAYKAAMAQMKAIDADLPKAERGAAVALRDGQRAWITYRDAACTAEGYTMHGGSAEPMVIYDCYARVTENRTADLWELVFTAEAG